MTTIEVTILADDDDQEFVVNILTALAQKHLIHFDFADSFPAEGPELTTNDLATRIDKAESGRRYSYEEAKAKLGL